MVFECAFLALWRPGPQIQKYRRTRRMIGGEEEDECKGKGWSSRQREAVVEEDIRGTSVPPDSSTAAKSSAPPTRLASSPWRASSCVSGKTSR
eukprot:9188081-Pyramimonas_sp.AAC.1